MDKPLLLIDIDGVLNVVRKRSTEPPPGYAWHHVDNYWLLLTPKHGEWLTAFADRFELVWATTWMGRANEAVGPLVGLPEMPYIKFNFENNQQTFKLPEVQAYVGDRPAVWIDDDLWPDAYGWAGERTRAGIPTLLIQPYEDQGLLRKHIKRLERFADEVASWEPLTT